ncbi:hypothetical protein [Streptomyces sp. MST-110588]|uniref:hypothetical protein n=1 Tax=Streptomyces sp. MST-110588 TaxID=2833628 RepID=UPI001F5DE947|nr:hypothetical protein [Streptomyces sp. MST-110588]UNO42812.1 hypothetical protein KGS77_28880 [Streptomyces sp. MST-110588]
MADDEHASPGAKGTAAGTLRTAVGVTGPVTGAARAAEREHPGTGGTDGPEASRRERNGLQVKDPKANDAEVNGPGVNKPGENNPEVNNPEVNGPEVNGPR